MFHCNKTSKTFNTQQGLLNHLRFVYSGIANSDIFLLENPNYVIPKCICGNDGIFVSFFKGYIDKCNDSICITNRKKLANSKGICIRLRTDHEFPIWLINNLDNIMAQYTNSNEIYIEYYDSYIEKGKLRSFLSKKLSSENIIKILNVDRNCKFCDKKIITKLFIPNKTIYCSTGCHIKHKNILDGKISKVEYNKLYGNRFVPAEIRHKICFFCKTNFIDKYRRKSTFSFCNMKCYREAIKIPELKKIIQPVSDESKRKASDTHLKKIENGYMPVTTNIFGKTFRYNGIMYRSTWELLFHLINESFKFEHIRIPYIKNEKPHLYVIDFFDGYTMYEVKPKKFHTTSLNLIKQEYARRYAVDNNLLYVIIDEDYFYNNVDVIRNKIEELEDSDIKLKLIKSLKHIEYQYENYYKK